MNAPLKMSPGNDVALTCSKPPRIGPVVRAVGAQKPPRAPPPPDRPEQRLTPAANWSLYWPYSPYRTVAPIGLQALRQKGLMYQESVSGLLTANDTFGLPPTKSTPRLILTGNGNNGVLTPIESRATDERPKALEFDPPELSH